MAYLNEDGLARYDGLLKNWVTFKSGTVDGVDPLLNWQKTDTAGAVTCYPLPAAPLDPVVTFAFTETGPAEGTKGPDNPSTISGVSSVKVTRCGKNLLPNYSDSSRGIWTVNPDGSVTAAATSNSSQTWFNLVTLPDGFVLHPGTYTISGCTGGSSSTYCFNFNTKKADGTVTYRLCSTQPVTFTLTEKETVAANLYVAAGVTLDYIFHPQLELAGTASNYEQAVPTDYPVSLGGTYYGGSVDLSTGVMTVTWVGESINSANHTATSVIQTNTIGASYITQYRSYGAAATLTGLVCDKFEPMNGDGDEEHVRLTGGANGSYTENIYINRSRLDLSGASDPNNPTLEEALAAVNAWLAVNPVFIAYRLFTPFTVSLTPTQIYSLSQLDPYTPRLNTVYSDQISVQVGYPKSPLATSTELTNAIVSLGGNI